MDKQWRGVVGFERLYEVSENGDVRSLNRLVAQTNNGGTVYIRPYFGKDLKPWQNGNGYWNVHLVRDGVLKIRPVHQLVAECYIGPRPAGMEICHCDGDKGNNDWRNLRYDTHAGNMQDMSLHRRLRIGSQARGEIHGPS